MHDRLRAEHQVEADYSRLSSFAGADAKTRAARADVRGVEKVIARVQAEDERLGHQRPERVAALLASVRDELDAARRLRLARDQWSVKIGTYRSYRRAVSAPLASLDLIASSLDDIKRLAGPEVTELPRLLQRVGQVLRALASIVPPSDLAPVHTLIESAARLAEQAGFAKCIGAVQVEPQADDLPVRESPNRCGLVLDRDPVWRAVLASTWISVTTQSSTSMMGPDAIALHGCQPVAPSGGEALEAFVGVVPLPAPWTRTRRGRRRRRD